MEIIDDKRYGLRLVVSHGGKPLSLPSDVRSTVLSSDKSTVSLYLDKLYDAMVVDKHLDVFKLGGLEVILNTKYEHSLSLDKVSRLVNGYRHIGSNTGVSNSRFGGLIRKAGTLLAEVIHRVGSMGDTDKARVAQSMVAIFRADGQRSPMELLANMAPPQVAAQFWKFIYDLLNDRGVTSTSGFSISSHYTKLIGRSLSKLVEYSRPGPVMSFEHFNNITR